LAGRMIKVQLIGRALREDVFGLVALIKTFW
jgi:hypothetical protein